MSNTPQTDLLNNAKIYGESLSKLPHDLYIQKFGFQIHFCLEAEFGQIFNLKEMNLLIVRKLTVLNSAGENDPVRIYF